MVDRGGWAEKIYPISNTGTNTVNVYTKMKVATIRYENKSY